MRNEKITRKPFAVWGAFLMAAMLLFSCSSAKQSAKPAKRQKAKIVAVADIDPLAPEARRQYDYYFLEAMRLKQKGEYTAAFKLLQHCLAIDPNAASALYEISQFYLYLKQPQMGLETMERAVKNAPDNYWYKQALAGFYQSNGNFKKAIDVFEDMSVEFTDRQEPLLILVDLYNRVKDYPNVIKTLDRLESSSGKTEQISMEKFRIYLMMGNDKKAFDEIESLSKEYPSDMRYLCILGDVYLNNGKVKEAYDTYQKVLSIEPDNAMALVSMATYYDKMGEKDLYRQQLDTVLLNKKVVPEIKLEIMRQLIVQSEQSDRDSTKIISLFDNVLKQNKDDAQIPMLYAQYLISKKMDKESVPVLYQVLDIDPENIPARLQLLSYAIRNNDYKEAIKICEPALEYSPETLEFYFYLGIAYFQDDRKDDALEVYKKGLTKIDDKSNKQIVSDFYSMIGDIYHEKEMKNEAYAAYDSSLVYNPDNIGALNNYAYYLSVEKRDLDKAEEMSYRTVKAEPNNSTYLDTYAWILFEKGKYAEAKIYMDDAMKNGGGDSDVVVEHCGDIYYMNGEKEEALKYWQKAKEMGSKSETLKKKIEQKKFIAE